MLIAIIAICYILLSYGLLLFIAGTNDCESVAEYYTLSEFIAALVVVIPVTIVQTFIWTCKNLR